MVPVRPTELGVAGDERRTQSLRQRNIGGVVSGNGIAQLPNPLQERLSSNVRLEPAGRCQPAQRINELYVQKMRRVQFIPKDTVGMLLAQRRPQQDFQGQGGIQDDHRKLSPVALLSDNVCRGQFQLLHGPCRQTLPDFLERGTFGDFARLPREEIG